ncbi:multiheme c-type cytochrome [Novipirellula caenicola]|uniref:Cytochrome c-552/4 domain-containing protein n=1 Tax=Novipirellula caenicola TaxID=1536901 RepID=A0ABP9W585_9BACT
MASTSFFARQIPSGILFVLFIVTGPIGWTQTTPDTLTREEKLSDPVYMSWVASEPVGRCVSCHVMGPTDAEIDSGRSGDLTSFSRRSEMMHWLQKDKHTIARRRIEPFAAEQSEDELLKLYERLDSQIERAIEGYKRRGETIDRSQVGLESIPEEWIGQSNLLSRRICDKLWGSGSVTTEAGYAKFRDHCLTCHGGYHDGASGFDLADLDNAQLGIDCLYCHQQGENDQWVTPHQVPEKWRLQPPQAKSAAGMRNLVDTSNQAQLCMDCHVGNRSKNMFVSHEMYAAGHPPIPSIELQQFCAEMPQHWQTPTQLYQSLADYPQRNDYFNINYPGLLDSADASDVFWNTRKMLIGALVARQQMLDLYIQSEAAQDWADYSLYDCAACHHELRSNSLRQQRGYVGAPGRPRQYEWPDALLTIAYLFSGKETLTQSRAMESELEQLFSEQPFGDPHRIAAAATQLSDHITTAIDTIEQKPLDARIALAVLRGLATTPKSKLVTYDAARQVIWAMQTIASELEIQGKPLAAELHDRIRQLGDPEVTGVSSNLPSGRKQFIYPDRLEADLHQRAQYDPSRLAAQLQRLRTDLAQAAN